MKDILIDIKHSQSDSSKAEQLKLNSRGKFAEKNGSFLIIYNDSILSDEYGNVKTQIRVSADNSVTIIRTGAYNNRISLACGKRVSCRYSTPFGTTLIDFFGRSVANELSSNGGRLHFSYDVYSAREIISKNEIDITVIVVSDNGKTPDMPRL